MKMPSEADIQDIMHLVCTCHRNGYHFRKRDEATGKCYCNMSVLEPYGLGACPHYSDEKISRENIADMRSYFYHVCNADGSDAHA
jgi:hypothetical protein